ncbi:MAG: sensor histidine kinase, partial [Limisphaerales bacterium]
LAECKEESADKESLQDIIQSVDKLDVWIQRLLGFARPLSVEPVKTELSGLIADCLRLSEAQLQAKKIAVEDRIGQIPPVAADPSLLEQVLSAVIINALEAMNEGGNLSIQATADGREATLSVSDTGKGIPAGMLERVFKPFVTDKLAGTGLGLAQAKKIVDLHGGEIKVESRPGTGTTVSVTLPLWREEN